MVFSQVTISDNGDPPLTSTTRVVVKVLDVNDHAPTFFQRLQRCYVPQMPKQGPTLCQVCKIFTVLYDFDIFHLRKYPQSAKKNIFSLMLRHSY